MRRARRALLCATLHKRYSMGTTPGLHGCRPHDGHCAHASHLSCLGCYASLCQDVITWSLGPNQCHRHVASLLQPFSYLSGLEELQCSRVVCKGVSRLARKEVSARAAFEIQLHRRAPQNSSKLAYLSNSSADMHRADVQNIRVQYPASHIGRRLPMSPDPSQARNEAWMYSLDILHGCSVCISLIKNRVQSAGRTARLVCVIVHRMSFSTGNKSAVCERPNITIVRSVNQRPAGICQPI